MNTNYTITRNKKEICNPTFFSHLKCKECNKKVEAGSVHYCEDCCGPLEVIYDYEEVRKNISREIIKSRGENIWRYKELLPIKKEPTLGTQTGFTPLIKAERLAKKLGVKEIWIKNDAVSYPTLSFKDRVVSVALNRAVELGFKIVACASTGNLANSVAATAASAGLKSYVLIPANLEKEKILASQIYGSTVIGIEGTYDEVNRLCSEIGGNKPWGFVNINLRAYYSEGSKTVGFEILEQLGWKLPKHTVVPAASGSLLTKIYKGYNEFIKLGLVEKEDFKIHGAQASGCSPISTAFKRKSKIFRPVKTPNTIAKSLAIGNPADAYYALEVFRENGGSCEDCNDAEIIEAIQLLAETTGVFAETAGGVTLACTKKLIESGVIPKNESIVICITGNGLKTQSVLSTTLGEIKTIKPTIEAFEAAI